MCGNRVSRFGRSELKHFVGTTEVAASALREIPARQYHALFPGRAFGYTRNSGAKPQKLDDRATWPDEKWREIYRSQGETFFNPPKWVNKEYAEKGRKEVENAGGIDGYVQRRMHELANDPHLGMFLVAGSPPQAIDRIVKWERTEKPTTCGARCRNARGPMCDCVCEGQFHGAGVAMSRARFSVSETPEFKELDPHEQRQVLEYGYGIYEVTLKMPDVGMNIYRIVAAKSKADAVKYGRIIAKTNGYKVAAIEAKSVHSRTRSNKTQAARTGRNTAMSKFKVGDKVAVSHSSLVGIVAAVKPAVVLDNIQRRGKYDNLEPEYHIVDSNGQSIGHHRENRLVKASRPGAKAKFGFNEIANREQYREELAKQKFYIDAIRKAQAELKSAFLADFAEQGDPAMVGDFNRVIDSAVSAMQSNPKQAASSLRRWADGITAAWNHWPHGKRVVMLARRIAMQAENYASASNYSRPGGKAAFAANDVDLWNYFASLDFNYVKQGENGVAMYERLAKKALTMPDFTPPARQGQGPSLHQMAKQALADVAKYRQAVSRYKNRAPWDTYGRPGDKTTNKEPDMNRIEMSRPGAKDAFSLGQAAAASGIDRPENDEALRELVKKVGGDETVRLFARWDEGRKAAFGPSRVVPTTKTQSNGGTWTKKSAQYGAKKANILFYNKNGLVGSVYQDPENPSMYKAFDEPSGREIASGSEAACKDAVEKLAMSRPGAKSKFSVEHRIDILRQKVQTYLAKGGSWEGLDKPEGLAGLVGDIINGRTRMTDAGMDAVESRLRKYHGMNFSRPGAKAKFAHPSWHEGMLGAETAPQLAAYSWIDRSNVPVQGRTHMLLADLAAGVHKNNPSLSIEQAVLAAAKDMVRKGVATGDLRTWAENGGRFSRPGAKSKFAVTTYEQAEHSIALTEERTESMRRRIADRQKWLDRANALMHKADAGDMKAQNEVMQIANLLEAAMRGPNGFSRPGAKARFSSLDKIADKAKRWRKEAELARSFDNEDAEKFSELMADAYEEGIRALRTMPLEKAVATIRGLKSEAASEMLALLRQSFSRPGAKARFANWKVETSPGWGNFRDQWTASIGGRRWIVTDDGEGVGNGILYVLDNQGAPRQVKKGSVDALKYHAEHANMARPGAKAKMGRTEEEFAEDVQNAASILSQWATALHRAMGVRDYERAKFVVNNMKKTIDSLTSELQRPVTRLSRPGAKAGFGGDTYYTVATHIGSDPAGERTFKDAAEAKAHAKAMLESAKSRSKGKPVVVDVYPVVNYSPQDSILTLKA